MSSIIVDTSFFIDFLRGKDLESLPPLIIAGQITLSAVVKLELLAGVRKSEMTLLEDLLTGLNQLSDLPPIPLCQKMLSLARGRGILGGIPDLMILADCERTNSTLLTLDRKLIKLAQQLKIKIWEIE